MVVKNLPRAIAEECVELVNQRLRLGDKPKGQRLGGGRTATATAAEIAIAKGIVNARQTFTGYLEAAKELYGLAPDESLWRAARYQQPQPRSMLQEAPPQDPEAFAFNGPLERVLVIPDLHQDPRHPDRADVLLWAGRLCRDRKISRVVQLGDWGTFDSASRHDRNETLKARLKPTIQADLESVKESLALWNKGKGDWKPKQLMTMGNHEDRLRQFENNNPESHGTFTTQLEEMFAQFGWRTAPYGELRYVNGVGFTHHPTNGMGRAFGGKTGQQRAANEMTCSLVSGHTHQWKFTSVPKIGPSGGLDLMEAGCAMLWGEVEHYAIMNPTDWWWGLTIIDVVDGRIPYHERLPMYELRERYSDDGADVS